MLYMTRVIVLVSNEPDTRRHTMKPLPPLPTEAPVPRPLKRSEKKRLGYLDPVAPEALDALAEKFSKKHEHPVTEDAPTSKSNNGWSA